MTELFKYGPPKDPSNKMTGSPSESMPYYIADIWNHVPPTYRHDKTNKMRVRPANTQISLGIRPV